MTAAGSTSWCGFAQAIFQAGVLSTQPRVQPIPSSDYPTPARRPSNSVLSNDKFAHTFGFRLPTWQQQLNEVLTGMQVETAMRASG
jgi:dTDP-4-dehydrorhamnose reductase